MLSILVKHLIHTSPIVLNNLLYEKLFNNTILIYLHFFLTGIFIYKNFDWLLPFLKEKAIIWLLIYAAYVLIFKFWLKLYDTNYEISVWGVGGSEHDFIFAYAIVRFFVYGFEPKIASRK